MSSYNAYLNRKVKVKFKGSGKARVNLILELNLKDQIEGKQLFENRVA